MKFLLRILVILVAVIAVLLGVLTAVAGSVVKSYINDNGPSLIGRQMHVEDASVNLFTGAMRLDSLFVAEADGQSRFLSVHQFNARLSVPKLFMGTYDLDHVDVDQLRLDVEQRDTVFNFSDILAFLGEDDADDEPLPLVLRNINIHNSYIRYQDLLVRSDFRINDFSLFIPGVDLRNINTSVGMDLSLGDGGQLSTKVDYDEGSQTYKVNLLLTDFNLQSILPYVRQQIAFGDLEGTLGVNLEMQGSMKHMLDFSLRGKAGVRDLRISDPDGQPMVECDTVAIDVRDLDLTRNRIELGRIVFDKPNIRIAYGKDSLDNFSRLMVQAAAEAQEQPEASSEASVSFNGKDEDLRLVIDRLSIQDATVSYRDESLMAEPFVYALSAVNFSAPNFTLAGKNHITISARLGERGRLNVVYDGKVTDQRNMHLTLSAEDVAFSDFSPYTVQMFGNEVTQGTLSVNMLATTVDGSLTSQNRFVLVDPKVEKKRKDINPEMSIPFRAGMYMLTDRNNVCDIDLPVKGNIDEPRFSYKRLIFRTLGKLIVKVCTSPFRRSRSSAGVALSTDEVLQLDDRSLDDISLDSISSDMLIDE